MFDKIIFVCTDNNARSPMAETIYKSLAEDGGIPSISRGMVVLFSEPVSEKAETVLENHGLTLTVEASEELIENDITKNSLLLTMTEKQKAQVIEKFGIKEQVFTIKEFNGEEGEVKDPYGGTLVDYEECFNELLRLIKKTIYKLDEMGK
ncbi:MAG: arsenate reductase/protein-tyrosine-phosphatase family protein [Catonella sp.]|uniref:arsenate reductase/protein-tyrosine-phosphatase family protein n=1 Tax=Catonella sp. TaxID=2382125 RepID=UPI003FA090F9